MRPIEDINLTPHASRVFGLDALRAFAILTTVYGHGYVLTDRSIPAEVHGILEFDGVTMFFVLSGFLIGRILLRTIAKRDFGAKMLAEFWIRRWFRTLPNYMLVLVLLVIEKQLSGAPQPPDLIAYFLFSQNIAAPHPVFFGEAWSLSVEEWFYLVVPIPLYLLTRFHRLNRETAVMIWIVGIIVSVTAFRFYRAYHFGYSYEEWDLNLRKQVVTRLDSLMYGVLGAYLSIYKPNLWRDVANKAFWAGIFLHVSLKVYWDATHNLVFMNYLALTLVPVCTLLLLPKLSDMKRVSGKIADTITFISLISYSMYLIHGTLVQTVILPVIMDRLAKSPWIAGQHIYMAQYLVYWIITFAGSFLLYRCFERPTTAMRDKIHVRGQVAVKAFTENRAPVRAESYPHSSADQ